MTSTSMRALLLSPTKAIVCLALDVPAPFLDGELLGTICRRLPGDTTIEGARAGGCFGRLGTGRTR